MARIYGIEHLYFGLHLRMHMFYTSEGFAVARKETVYQTFPYIFVDSDHNFLKKHLRMLY